jgi:hypothetical protein
MIPSREAKMHKTIWIGRILTGITILLLAMSGFMKIAPPKEVVDTFVGKFGYPASALFGIGILELACAAVYAVPRTAALGAVLVTGYLGGAVATHVRVADPFVVPLVLGILAWGGLYLRDERVRSLLPFRG